MSHLPTRVVVDTNVATTANSANSGTDLECVAASAKALQKVMRDGVVFLDDAGLIMHEYRANLNSRGQPGPGDAFMKWVLTHEWSGTRVTRVPLTPKTDDPDDFDECPVSDRVHFDRSDRKFLAVAHAHPDRPQLLQSFDSKWWGWQEPLKAFGVKIVFLCPHQIAAKHGQKMGRTKK